MPEQQWQVQLPIQPPAEFIDAVKRHAPASDGRVAAQLLWQRGIRDTEHLAGFLNPEFYQPASPFEFGQEMQWAVERITQARDKGEAIAIWGDFDADGITATSVLWEGLGQFFPQHLRLSYYIPNRLTESHGLNKQGIDALAQAGTNLIVTCDTGSTNISELEYARTLGLDIIITDHHALPPERPPVLAIVNPRYLPASHQMYHLSGVAVAYKLIEALYETLPDVPKQPLEDLLDLVAIGLIADLVQLSGDCRYLAQRGIQRLQQQAPSSNARLTRQQPRTSGYRPGVARLLELCQKNGDRPTDISFGLGPRINAVSRIHGDASFCVELLASRDEKRCYKLASETELANTRRKSLQKDLEKQVKNKLAQLDLSTTSVIVLVDSQWAVGVLGLVAAQLAQEYGRPTILLSTEGESESGEEGESGSGGEGEILQSQIQNPIAKFARGSARSVLDIDLYDLVKSQAHLLERFGGHPFAAGLSLLVENIPMFTQAINQQLRQLSLANGALMTPTISADLVCTVRQLGQDLFRELKLLEPCGMGNPVPKLLIQNCWFENVRNQNTQDLKGRKVQYIKTELEICDNSTDIGFPGVWWGHYREEVPTGRGDAIVELDYNNYKKRAEVRIIAVRPTSADDLLAPLGRTGVSPALQILDWRNGGTIEELPLPESVLPVRECPSSWYDLQVRSRRAMQSHQNLALAYPPPEPLPAREIWQQLVGIAKYLSRTGKTATLAQLHEKIGLSDRTLQLGLQALSHLGFQVKFRISGNSHQSCVGYLMDSEFCICGSERNLGEAVHPSQFIAAVQEEQFTRRYFYLVTVSTIQAMTGQSMGST